MSKITIIEGNSNNKDNVRAIMVKGEKGEQGDLNNGDIIDNLTSDATDKVLSANQGKILKDLNVINANNILENTENIINMQENLNNEKAIRANADTNLQSQISGLANGSPLVASSVSEMTDTTRVYVNTTDGNWYYYNGSSWVSGGVYQATQETPFSITNEDLADESVDARKLKGHSVLNLFDSNDPDIQLNKRMNYYQNDIVIADYNNYAVSGWISVYPGQVLFSDFNIPYNVNAIGFFDKEKKGLSVRTSGTSSWNILGQVTIPDNCYYIRLGMTNNAVTANSYGIYTSSSAPSNYIPHNYYTLEGLHISEDNIIPSGENQTVFTLKADGTGDYSTLRQALENLKDTSGNTLEIYPGTYNVLNDYTTEEINAAAYSAGNIESFCGPAVKGNINIIGIGNREEIILNGELDSETYTNYIRGQISTLNVSGNITLKNLTIKSKNIRYAIHDDFIANANTEINIENCIVIGGTKYDGITLSSAYGMGTRSGKITNFENCYLSPNFYEHTNYSFSKPSITSLKNCIISRSIQIDDMGSGKNDKVYIKNCNVQCINYKWYNNNIQKSCVEVLCDNDIHIFYDHNANLLNEKINNIYNNTDSSISLGTLLKQTDFYDFEPMSLNDDVSLFYGVALDSISSSDFGRVLKKGYVLATDLGISTTTIGTKYTISNGILTPTTGNNYIAICDVSNYIKFI